MQRNPQPLVDITKVPNTELVELLRHYNLYATSTGGDKSAQVIPGPVMLAEIKRRLIDDPKILKDTKVIVAPLHILMNHLGKDEAEIEGELWTVLFEIGQRGLWPTGFHELTETFKYIMRLMFQHGVFELMEENLVVLSITGQDNPPAASDDQRVSSLIFPTPYEGWYIHVLSKKHHEGMTQEDFTRRGFFNLPSIPPNKLDII